MPAELIKIHPLNPEQRKIRYVADILQNGGIIVYPTDTVYGLGCNLMNKRAIEKLCHLLNIRPQKLDLSFICVDISQVSDYVRRIDTPVYKLMKKVLPGPYTFILEASSHVPRILEANKKTVGIRIPNHAVPRLLVQALGNPMISASMKSKDVREYATDPDEMFENLRHAVDIVIDSGAGGNIPSTIINCTGPSPEIVRQGLGSLEV